MYFTLIIKFLYKIEKILNFFYYFFIFLFNLLFKCKLIGKYIFELMKNKLFIC